MTRAIVMFTNEVHHPRANFYAEGFRHCMVFLWCADGWYGREFRPGAGEIIYPHAAEPDANFLARLRGNAPEVREIHGDDGSTSDMVQRKTHVVECETQYRYQRWFTWYRNRPTAHVKHYIGLANPKIRRPYHLFQYLDPSQQGPKKLKPVAAIVQHLAPVK